MRNMIGLLCSLVILVTLFVNVASPITVSAETSDFLYFIDDGVTIYLYNGSATEVVIPDTIEGYPVTEINSEAFCYCTSLTSVTIPDSVTRVGEMAFYGCTSLQTIIIPDSVTHIGNWAFSRTAYYDDETNWENGVLYVGNHLIAAKNSVQGDYAVKEGTKTIADYAFKDAVLLTSMTIPDSVAAIGVRAFAGCTSLAAVTVCENNTAYCSKEGVLFTKDGTTLMHYPAEKSATSYTVPKDVTAIEQFAFNGCDLLKSVILPDGLTSIGNSMFSGCTSLESITIPNGVISIGDTAFYQCTSLQSVILPNSITSIESAAFSNCSSLTSIVIPNSVTRLGGWVFEGCSSLTDITVPDTLMYIGECAFHETAYYNDENNWENNVLYVGKHAYTVIMDVMQEELVVAIKEGTKTISSHAFQNYWMLTDITIPNSVTRIGDMAFDGCRSLTSIAIPDSVTSIGHRAFYNCTSMEQVTLSNGVASIGEHAFEGCTALTSITLPNSLESIGGWAFYGCECLTSISIPERVTSIQTAVFQDCASLTTVNIPKGVMIIEGYAFNNCVSLESVTIPDSVTCIENRAFSWCDSLKNITIPDSVEKIGEAAFYGDTILDTVYYGGSPSDWASMDIKENNDPLINAAIVFAKTDETIVMDEGVFTVTETGCTLTEYSGVVAAGKIRVPQEVDGHTVTAIGAEAFSGCEGVTHIVIADTVTSIDPAVFDALEDVKVVGYKDSFAHQFAAENDVPFVMLADVTGDKEINLNDATQLFYQINGLSTLEGDAYIAADYDFDDTVSLADATRLFYSLNGLL